MALIISMIPGVMVGIEFPYKWEVIVIDLFILRFTFDLNPYDDGDNPGD